MIVLPRCTVVYHMVRQTCGKSMQQELAYMQNRLTNSQWYLVVGLVRLVGLGLLLTVTIKVSRVSAMVSARFSVH